MRISRCDAYPDESYVVVSPRPEPDGKNLVNNGTLCHSIGKNSTEVAIREFLLSSLSEGGRGCLQGGSDIDRLRDPFTISQDTRLKRHLVGRRKSEPKQLWLLNTRPYAGLLPARLTYDEREVVMRSGG